MLSGGLDSPIAVYLMIQRGFDPICLSFLTSDDEEHSMKNKIVAILQILTKFTKRKIKIYFINHDQNLGTFKQKGERKLTCVLCKRLMIRIAKEFSKRENTNIIVTGDILGEQASQTLDNLHAYNQILGDNIILRPLIGFNKEDVIKLDKKIGLYDLISQKSAGCTFYPQFPETHAKLHEVLNSESRFEISEIINHSLKNAEILEI